MHACVRFNQDAGNRLHVIPVTDIHNFHPENEDDFNNKTNYEAFWTDEVDGTNTGDYSVRVLLLGGMWDIVVLFLYHPSPSCYK